MSLQNSANSEFLSILAEGSNSFLVETFLEYNKILSFFNMVIAVAVTAIVLFIVLATLFSALNKIKPDIKWELGFKLLPYYVVLSLIAGFVFVQTTPHLSNENFKPAPSAEALARIDKLEPYEVSKAVDLLTVKGCFSVKELQTPTICSAELQSALLKKATEYQYRYDTDLPLGGLIGSWRESVNSGNYLVDPVVKALKAKDFQTGMLFEERLSLSIAKLSSTPQTNFNFVKKFYASAESLKDSCGSLSKNNCDLIKAAYVAEVKKLAGDVVFDSSISKENYAIALEKAKSL